MAVRAYAFSATNGDLLVSSDETGVYNAYRLDVTGQMTALTQSDDRGVYVGLLVSRG